MDRVSLGIKIQEARERKHMTQETLAEAVNYSVDHISVIERGQKSPRLEKLIDIANTLDVGMDSLLGSDLRASAKIESSLIYERIVKLPLRKQRLVLRVLDTLVTECEKDRNS